MKKKWKYNATDFFFYELGFTPCKTEWSLPDMELQEKAVQRAV